MVVKACLVKMSAKTDVHREDDTRKEDARKEDARKEDAVHWMHTNRQRDALSTEPLTFELSAAVLSSLFLLNFVNKKKEGEQHWVTNDLWLSISLHSLHTVAHTISMHFHTILIQFRRPWTFPVHHLSLCRSLPKNARLI